ncbi:MAG: nuclear transport factor 2 family protein, partial [Actinobacteria bacterium]|nr:nuclear transport factor 2 family protein [Actinomycetota bacterium]
QHIRKEAKNGPHYVVAGEYLDQLVRTPDGWRIKYRILNTLWTEGNREVATGDK